MKYIFTFLVIIFASILYSQDIHFSSWEEMPHVVNPAFTGSISGNYKNRAIVSHRKQWNSALGRADYETYYGAYDHKVSFCNDDLGGFYLGLGLDLYHDHVGTLLGSEPRFFEHNRVKGSIAFGFVPSESFSIVAGTDIGWMNYRLDDSQLTFDNQFGYIGNSQYDYNPTLSSGEAFSSDNINYLDIGAGFLIRGKTAQSLVYEGGVSFLHLNNTNKKFLENSNDSELLREYRVHGKIGFNINSKKSLNIYLIHYKYGGFFKRDGRQWQINQKSELKIKANSTNDFYVGGGFRLSNIDGAGVNPDALILSAKWKPYIGKWNTNSISNMTVGIAYDFNISPYSIKATNAMGALELYMSFAFGKDKKVCCYVN